MDYNSKYLNFNQPNFSQIIFFMKQKLFGAASLVAFILFGASCSQQEQSEFNLDSVKQEVTISATVTYSTGVDVNATSYSIINSKPAAGRKVFIEVPYAQYGNAAALGNKIFETVTDEAGKFSITIPTKSTGINATIRMEEFTDVYRTYEKMGADGKPVFKSELRNYSFSVAANALKPGAFRFPEEIVYASEKIDVDQFANEVTMTGKVNLAYETGFRKGAFKAADKATVEFTVIYDYGTTAALELKFGTVTDSQGNYSITLPVKSLADGFHITGLKVLGIGDSQFTHFDSDTTSVKVYGAYELMNFGNTAGVGGLNFANIIDGVTYNLGAQNLLFTPYYNASITDADQAQPDNWDDNLVGWAAGMPGFDESYSKTATLTGKIYMPYLTSFGEGAYRNESQTIVLTAAAPYNTGLTVITDAQGNFSVDIPVQDDNALNFGVKLAEEVQPFEFIDSKGKKTVLREGKYNGKTQIKKDDAQWFELGDFYFKYNPAVAESPDEWNANLIGWYRSSIFDKPVQVKGKILFAVESSYGIGEYVAQTRIVNVHDATNNRDFAIKTKAGGAYDFMIPLQDENDQPNIAITSDEYYTNEYVHYPKYNDDGTKLLAGNYTIYKTVYDSKDDKEAWNNLGTQYMYIDDTDLDHATSTYNDNLAGWYLKADGNDVVYTNTAKASGKAFKAEETGFLTGEYKAAKGQLVILTVYGDDIAVLANNTGSFSFNVPLKNAGDETNITVAAAAIEVDDFKHYKDASGKTQILEGTYDGESVKEDGAAWNELGNVYYKFSPSTPFTQWTKYAQWISGWAYKKGYNVKQAVTGTAMIAVEDGFRAGHYEAAKKLPVKITTDGGTTYYVAPTDNEGNWSIDVLLQFADDELGVTWDGSNFPIEDLGLTFTHYRNPGSDATMNLEGDYTVKSTINSSTKWYEKGIRYYSFDADGAPKNWETDLYGWYVWAADEKTTLTIEGNIKKAAEVWKTSAQETWVNAANALADVTVDGKKFKVVTNGSGKFTVQVKVKEQPDNVTVTVKADNITETSFQHWTDQGVNGSKKVVPGKFKNAGNVTGTVVSKSGTSTRYPLEHSAKMTFTPDELPLEGWGSYDWSTKYDDEE